MMKFNPELNPITIANLETTRKMAMELMSVAYCYCIGDSVKFSIVMPDLRPSLAVDKNGLVYQIDYAGSLD